VIVIESDNFNFVVLPVNEERSTSVKNELPDFKVCVQNNALMIQNMMQQEIKVAVYNTIGQLFLPPFLINPDGTRAVGIPRGIYFIRIEYTDRRGYPKIYTNPVEVF